MSVGKVTTAIWIALDTLPLFFCSRAERVISLFGCNNGNRGRRLNETSTAPTLAQRVHCVPS